jgi:hypothetical protein
MGDNAKYKYPQSWYKRPCAICRSVVPPSAVLCALSALGARRSALGALCLPWSVVPASFQLKHNN